MSSAPKGSFRLFRVLGIDVSLHWSWLAVAFYQIGQRADDYSSLTWNVAEYLSLFFIVLLHEFGHALACRQVGGRADKIMLWPLGGVAYIAPPERPGPVLWSIAAGPLVNVLLMAPLTAMLWFSRAHGWPELMPDAHALIRAVLVINAGLLIFNLLPIYPLDGGQILRALLWFFIGRARSLFATAVIGFAGVAGLLVLAYWMQSIWMGVLALYVFSRCRQGWQQGRALLALARAPRHAGFACPSCGAAPPVGTMWRCAQCTTTFDTFSTHGECPQCHTAYPTTQCLECGSSRPMSEWALLTRA